MVKQTTEKSRLLDRLKVMFECFHQNCHNGALVVLEGMPGAGKTSVLSALSRFEKDIVISKELDHVQQSIDPTTLIRTSDKEQWYIDSELARQLKIDSSLKDGGVVIQDRSVLSLLSYSYARSSMHSEVYRLIDLIERLIIDAKIGFIQPDLLLIFVVSQTVSRSRRARYENDGRYPEWFDRSFLSKYREFYELFLDLILPFPVKKIDTTDLSLLQVTEKVCQYLGTQSSNSRFGTKETN
jgi:thymidylate kinase